MVLFAEVLEAHMSAAVSGPGSRDGGDSSECKGWNNSVSGSTRASSPGSASSSSAVATSAPTSPEAEPDQRFGASTIADRRGIRAAILSDLGVDLVEKSSAPCSMQSPMTLLRTIHPSLQKSREASSPAFHVKTMDASQRSPVRTGNGFSLAATRSPAGTPKVNSTLVGNCLSSSPGTRGDASQRTPTASQRPPVVPTSWSGALQSAQATHAAAVAPQKGCLMPSSPASCVVPGCQMTHTGSETSAPVTAVRSHGVSTSVSSEVDVVMNALLEESGLAGLSNAELAAQLRQAAPAEYED